MDFLRRDGLAEAEPMENADDDLEMGQCGVMGTKWEKNKYFSSCYDFVSVIHLNFFVDEKTYSYGQKS